MNIEKNYLLYLITDGYMSSTLNYKYKNPKGFAKGIPSEQKPLGF
jgi:hypothetical protein